MTYQVGQFLYVTNQKKLSVIPVQIIQEVTIKDMEGEKTEYIVQFPDKNKTTAQLSEIGKETFQSIDAVKSHMIAKATKAISEICDNAISIQNDVFVKKPTEKKEITTSHNENDVQADKNNNIITVDLGNGVKAKMNTSNLEKVANQ